MHKNHPHSRLEVFEKSGHKIFADESEKFFTLLKNFLEESKQAKIFYRAGNRLTLPAPQSEYVLKLTMLRSLPDKDKDKQTLLLYEEAVHNAAVDHSFWNELSFYFEYKNFLMKH
ncbi:MAG: hypothetical protein HQK53_12685 [Oligoflexia bacterium]|nr:hypothetical protein [Oligoflexia bacterium]